MTVQELIDELLKVKDKYVWYNDSTNYRINERLFPEVKWSDKEPRELVLKPIKEEQP